MQNRFQDIQELRKIRVKRALQWAEERTVHTEVHDTDTPLWRTLRERERIQKLQAKSMKDTINRLLNKVRKRYGTS